MHGFFNYDGPVMRFLSKIFDMVVACILWLLCSLPIITIGASTTALYHICFKSICDEDDHLIKKFFFAFRKNFTQATIQWLILFASLIILAIDAYLILQSAIMDTSIGPILVALLLLFVLTWLAVFIYTFGLQSQFYNGTFETIKKAFRFSVAYLPQTGIMIILDVMIVYLCLRFMPVLIASGPVMANTYFLRTIFDKHDTQKAE